MTVYVQLQVWNGHCTRLHEFTFTHFSRIYRPTTYFLPRDAMRKGGLCCRPVSVRLSVTFVYCNCIQTAEDIVKLLSRPGIPVST